MRALILCILSLFFFATIQAQSITITQPNGGEMLSACQQYTIKWTASGTSNYYNIDYSLNGGAIWTSIASNLNVTNGQYVWTVPNVESNTCLVRIRDKNDTTKTDISDAVFSIHIPVVVTSPNGGEVWQAGTAHPITWNIQGTSLSFNIEYSVNGGSSWSTIVNNFSTSAGTYNWTVPNNPSTNCLVRVTDAVTGCMTDVSNNAFTITPAQPVLLSPNGGESLLQGCSYNITWTSSTFYSPVRLEYSADSGLTWQLITSSTTNSGSYSWTAPGAAGTKYLIRASNSANVSLYDVSNATFSVPRAMTVIYPNGGDTLIGCSAYTILVYKYFCSYGNYNIEYSTDNGATWNYIASYSASQSTPQIFTANWTVPNGITSTRCLVRGYSTSNSSIGDTSNSTFAILPSNVITVTSPNGGEVLAALSNKLITWTNTAGASGLYNVEYSPNNGSTWTTLATGISGNAYNWTNIPNNPSNTYLIRVSDNANTCRNDVSDANFTVTPAQPILLTPNGGENLTQYCDYTITWNAATFYSNVRLEYSRDSGVTWQLITSSATNSGSYSWSGPGTTGNKYMIKASNSANVNMYDISNATFSVQRPMAVLSSNGGDTLIGCNNYTVRVSKNMCTYGNYYIEYSTDNGATWNYLSSFSASVNTPQIITTSWSVPNGITSSQCLIRAYNTSTPAIGDTSDATFTILPSNVITVTSPNGGEILPALTSKVITWTNTAGASGLYNVEYSTNNGSTWTTLATGITGNSYNWVNIPNNPSTTYLVRVSDNANTCRNDVSNANFTVTATQPVLLTPNGGESLQPSCSYNITWDPNTFYGSVRLDLSRDSGLTWQVITSSTSNSGSYGWTVPSNPGGQLLVKASNSSNLSLYDVSNATFSIQRPMIVLYPNGGDTLLGCNAYNVRYTKNMCSYGNYVVEYSTDSGATWNYMTGFSASVNTPQILSYNWTVPNGITSTQGLVRIYSSYTPSIGDTSNSTFTILPNNVITVTSPNGGEVYPALGNTIITWTNTTGASGLYNVEYSTNNGSSWSTLATGVSGNSYAWNNIPNNPGTSYLVRVSDNANTCKNDVSNANFSVTPAQPVLLTPNGGESMQQQCNYNITWSSATFYSTVRLEYSADSGQTWQLITSGATNNGSYGWTVPTGYGNKFLVRASNSANTNLYDVSNATFSIQRAMSVTTQNNRDTLLGCNTYTVTVYKGFCSYGNYNIEYSTDSGATWNYLSQFAASQNTPQFVNSSWQVPNGLTSTRCLIRVYSYYYSNIGDTTNATFTILPNNVITVTSPNGGEVLPALSSKLITWTNTAGASGLYNVEYSSDNGNTWNNIATGISGNQFNWTNIPNNPTSTYRIRVSDNANTCKNDISDATFTVTPAQPILLTPNGGEGLTQYCDYTITWNAATFYGNVRLEYSADSGLTWSTITTSTTNNGSYSWSAPALTGSRFLVKASVASNLSLYDVSNATFSVLRPYTVLYPNGGDTLIGCNSYTVRFLKNVCLYGSYTLEYSTNGGATWTYMTGFSASNNTPQTFTYSWTVPNGITSTQCLVRGYYNSNPANSDTSNSSFTILPSNVITVTSPNGGEVFPALSSTMITWTNTSGASGLYNVEYSTNNGSSWTTLATNITGNSYNWTNIPNNPTSTYLVRVSDYANTCRNDVSDATFTVTPAQPLLLTPNGGEQLWSGSSYNITWRANSFYSNVRLEYSLDNGITWSLITSSTSNTGSYSWSLPNANSTTCLIKASNTSNTNLNDVSDAVFTIKPAVKVFTPNGYDILGACTQTSITFDHSPAYTSFNIEYSTNGGSTWSTLVTNQTFGGTTGTYSWTVPNIPTTTALVRVYPYGYTSLADQSDTTFTIKKAVQIIQPNYGGVLQVGTTYPIMWSSDGISNLYDIAYSTNGGGTWTNIVIGYNTSTNTYNWTVPNIPSTNCLIRIRDNINSCKQDISLIPFTISTSASPITVTHSNGLDTLYGCQNYNITWTESGAPLGSYTISYSTDGGSTWSAIVSGYATTSGSYAWVVPNINTTTALIRVASSGNSNIFDLSDASFAIISRAVRATPDTTICGGNQVQLMATGGTGTYTWTPSASLNNANVATPVASPATTTSYIVSSGNGSCQIRDTAVVTVLTGGSTAVGVSITASPSASACSGSPVTFTATPVNGGTTPSYQWKKNGANVGLNSPTYILSSPANNDVITCVLTSNAACATNNPATSNAVTITIFGSVTPSVAITTPATTVCSGQSVTFTATPTNGGNSPAYQWMINGVNAGTNSATFTTAALNNNDIVTCQLTSNAACASSTNVSSNAILMTVTPNVVPSVSITTPATTVCSGQPVTFTATPVNGGSNPSYQWKVNGITSGTNSATFTTSALTNNAQVTCVLTSNATCASPTSATSAAITMTVTGSIAPSVTVSASSTSICTGQSATFTATPANGGTTPAYQWYINATAQGSGSTFTSGSLNNNDTVRVVMTSSSGCASPASATSAPTVVAVYPISAPTVSITSTATTICSGTQVTFTASATNAGTNPSYQWKINGTNTGGNSATYISSALANNDTVYCIVTSASSCASPNNATSNRIRMTVTPYVTPSVSIAASSNSICSGNNVIFTATVSNGGSTPVYQWKLNGTSVGSNSASYASTTLANGDIVTCVLTSNATCASPATVTSNAVTMSVGSSAPAAVSITASATVICSGTSVTFTASATNGGAAPAYQWKVNGNNAGTNSATFTTATLNNNDVVTCQLTSSSACANPAIASSNAISMTVTPGATPSVSIAASATTICSGASVTFTATPVNGGAAPVYQWQVNGVNAGTNSPAFTTATLTNNAQVACILTSNATCLSTTTATSAPITITVTSAVVPAVSLSASSTSICASQSVAFTATPANGGATPTYQWYVNGTVQGGGSTFTSASLNNSDTVRVVMTSSAGCASPAAATSAPVVMTVNPTNSPSVTVATSFTTVCSGTQVIFTATATSAGSNPTYQWKVNGTNAGTNSSTFTTFSLANGDTVYCVLTSASACASPNSATSNKLKMTVVQNVTPSVSIATTSNSICAGNNVIFTATPVNGGTAPTYQWKVNGINVGTNSASYASATLANNDVVSCVMTSNAPCATPAAATSNSITMAVGSTAPVAISIAASSTTICGGAPVTFTATPVNGGSTPAYQWKVNGINAGSNSATFTSASLNNNDVVTCQITSSSACASPAIATSNAITISAGTAVTPSISISASATAVCSGSSVTFTAIPINGGSTPAYQWKVNGINAGTNSATFTSTSLSNNDQVSCILTSSAACATTTAATSNSVTITVTPAVVPAISISASATTICAGTQVIVTATATNGGGAPVYQWKVNGTNAGTNSSTLTTTTLSNNDVVTCILTSSAACPSPSSASSNSVTMTVQPVVVPSVSISASSTSICAGAVTFTATPVNGGTTPVYQWKVNGANAGTGGSTFTTASLASGDIVSCVLTSSAACATPSSASSNQITMTGTGAQPAITISSGGGSICAGTAASFTANVTNPGASQTYQWKINGVNAGTNSSSFSSATLNNGDTVTCQVTVTGSCVGTGIATSNRIIITITPAVTPAISITASQASICSGTAVTFTATASNGGTNPLYQWKVNGVNTGSNNAQFISSTLTQNDTVTCTLTSSATCAVPSLVVSNRVIISVTPSVTPAVSIAASSTSICQGAPVTFTATPVNGGANPTYIWYVNGSRIGTSSATYTTSSLSTGSTVSCRLVSSASCAAPDTIGSNIITVTVSAPVTPSVTITNTSGTVCAGTAVSFSATSTNGGSAPTYQWYVNGNPAGTSSTSFSSATLANGDVVSCRLTSNAACVTATTALSNNVTVTTTPQVTPSVTISTATTTICQGSSLTFTATATNGGMAPVYQWFVNGTAAGSNSSTFTTTTLQNGSVVTCKLASNATCASASLVTSNAVTITVNSGAQPTVTIAATADTICVGSAGGFTATALNAGTSPIYQWKVNGINAGTNSSTFTSTTLNNNDQITVSVMSTSTCSSGTIVISAPKTIHVLSPVTPAVSISASNTTICAGSNVTFTATASNSSSPFYQWMINGINTGTNAPTYASSSLSNNDIVSVRITTTGRCLSSTAATSAGVTMIVNPVINASVSISAVPSDTICEGTQVAFTATAVNGGTTPAYQWQVNGANTGTNAITYYSSSLSNGDIISVQMTSSALCASQPVVASTPVAMVVHSLPAVPAISRVNNVLTSSAPAGNQWYAGSHPVSGATASNYTINATGWYSVMVTNQYGCSSRSDSLQVVYTSIDDVTLSREVTIQPNPFAEKFTITIAGEAIDQAQWSVNITDVEGRLIEEVALGTNNVTVDLSDRSSGVYFVNVFDGTHHKAYKILKVN